jgi:hypothetical protein
MADSAPERTKGAKKRSLGARLWRTILIAILLAFAFGLVIGTVLRRQLDRPVRYMGSRAEVGAISVARAAHPGHVRDAPPSVLVAGQHEEQIG